MKKESAFGIAFSAALLGIAAYAADGGVRLLSARWTPFNPTEKKDPPSLSLAGGGGNAVPHPTGQGKGGSASYSVPTLASSSYDGTYASDGGHSGSFAGITRALKSSISEIDLEEQFPHSLPSSKMTIQGFDALELNQFNSLRRSPSHIPHLENEGATPSPLGKSYPVEEYRDLELTVTSPLDKSYPDDLFVDDDLPPVVAPIPITTSPHWGGSASFSPALSTFLGASATTSSALSAPSGMGTVSLTGSASLTTSSSLLSTGGHAPLAAGSSMPASSSVLSTGNVPSLAGALPIPSPGSPLGATSNPLASAPLLGGGSALLAISSLPLSSAPASLTGSSPSLGVSSSPLVSSVSLTTSSAVLSMAASAPLGTGSNMPASSSVLSTGNAPSLAGAVSIPSFGFLLGNTSNPLASSPLLGWGSAPLATSSLPLSSASALLTGCSLSLGVNSASLTVNSDFLATNLASASTISQSDSSANRANRIASASNNGALILGGSPNNDLFDLILRQARASFTETSGFLPGPVRTNKASSPHGSPLTSANFTTDAASFGDDFTINQRFQNRSHPGFPEANEGDDTTAGAPSFTQDRGHRVNINLFGNGSSHAIFSHAAAATSTFSDYNFTRSVLDPTQQFISSAESTSGGSHMSAADGQPPRSSLEDPRWNPEKFVLSPDRQFESFTGSDSDTEAPSTVVVPPVAGCATPANEDLDSNATELGASPRQDDDEDVANPLPSCLNSTQGLGLVGDDASATLGVRQGEQGLSGLTRENRVSTLLRAMEECIRLKNENIRRIKNGTAVLLKTHNQRMQERRNILETTHPFNDVAPIDVPVGPSSGDKVQDRKAYFRAVLEYCAPSSDAEEITRRRGLQGGTSSEQDE